MTSYSNIPLIPLRELVLFPNCISSFFVGREKSIEAIKTAMNSNKQIILIAQKEKEVVLPKTKDLYEIGVLCEVLQLLKMPDSNYKVLIEGIQRIKLEKLIDQGKYYSVDITTLDENSELNEASQKKLDESLKKLKENLNDFTNYYLNNEHEIKNFLNEIQAMQLPSEIIDMIAHYFPFSFDVKQKLLSTVTIKERLELLEEVLDKQLDIYKLKNKIHTKVKNKLDKVQKSYFLNEQLKAIKEELGEPEFDELKEYKNKMEELNLPEYVAQQYKNELSKLEKMPLMSAESTIIRNYLDWILDLPWDKFSEDNTDLSKAKEILEKHHYGLTDIKNRILEFIAVKKLSPKAKSPILCFVGPPGVGKTSLARSLAEALNREFTQIALGGVRDEAEIRGHRKTYIGSMPGRILNAFKQVGTSNPLILLDEIDKISSDYKGNPEAALLEVLDLEQNNHFVDHYLEIPFDLSNALFVATANDLSHISSPLLDRLEIIQLHSYTEQEKISIFHKFILKKHIQSTGIQKTKIMYNNSAVEFLIRHYTKEAGVRELERVTNQICRKIALDIVEKNLDSESKITKEKNTYRLDKSFIYFCLQSPKYLNTNKDTQPTIGKCNGLAWTKVGGEILHIETVLANGKDNLHITGNLGDIMKESAKIALGYIRSQAHTFSIPLDFFESKDMYVHVPAGAIPKDGPSAGVALALSLLSSITHKRVSCDIALTGELTLKGQVLPVGGIKEKILAAFQQNIFKIILPYENKKDLEKLDDNIKSKIKFYFIKNFIDLLDIAFVDKIKMINHTQMQEYDIHHTTTLKNVEIHSL